MRSSSKIPRGFWVEFARLALQACERTTRKPVDSPHSKVRLHKGVGKTPQDPQRYERYSSPKLRGISTRMSLCCGIPLRSRYSVPNKGSITTNRLNGLAGKPLFQLVVLHIKENLDVSERSE
jgi:hypothetical protein